MLNLIIQKLGDVTVFRLDVRATPADFIACVGHKWLNAPFGRDFCT